jgi:D-3-phosphoglycerate dehydrogenase
MAQAFHMEVQAFDPFATSLPPNVRRATTLVELLASSDVISVHAPLSAATRHLLGAAEFARCKPGAILVNTARGPLLDEAALLEALRGGRLAGAGLDVWDPEPPAADNPLLRLPNVVATPHVAAFTQEGRRRAHVAAATQVLQVLRGEQPPFLLNPAVWPRRRGR